MFTDYLTLFFLLKATTIHNFFGGPIFFFGIFLLLIYYFAVAMLRVDQHGYPKYSRAESAYQLQIARLYAKKFMRAVIITITISCLGNMLVPTTPQLAAIYFGVQAKHSETGKIVARLPAKLASYLEMELNKYLTENMPSKKK